MHSGGMRRLLLTGLLALSFPFLGAAQEGRLPLFGKVKDKVYTAPSGAYRITSPVLQELGGTISDSENAVVFQDKFTIHITIGCFQQDATQRWEFSTRGPKDYLSYFFSTYVFPDFQQAYPDTKVENVEYAPKLMDGTMVVYTLIPGGSMFTHRLAELAPGAPPYVAKRGNMLFVRHGYVYVISLEYAERLTEGHTFKLTLAEENAQIRKRLEDVIRLMEFARPAPEPAQP